LANDDVLTVNGAGATVMLSACEAVAFELSFTCTVKFAVPAAVAVPLIVPLAESERPAGSEPVDIDQALPPVPPLADSVWLYADPTVPLGSEDVVTINGGLAIVMLRVCVSVAFELSFTCAVKFPVPAVVGVPLIVPLAASDRPAGSAPALLDHV
jgi:hypothetical protein